MSKLAEIKPGIRSNAYFGNGLVLEVYAVCAQLKNTSESELNLNTPN